MATAASGSNPGIVIDWHDLRRIDTRELPWEEFDGLEGGKIRVLARDADGNASVMIVSLPAGELPSVALPHRHFHRSVREFSYVLSGELPHWEYESAEQNRGDLVVFREGYFMDRKPGSIHGLERGMSSATGFEVLMWRDGVGNWVDEPEFAQETADVPYADPEATGATEPTIAGADENGVVIDRPDLTLLDTRQMPWESFDGLPNGKVKVLSRSEDGTPIVMMVWLPPGEIEGLELPHRHYHRTIREFSFMLEGELPHWEYRNAEQQEGDLVVVRRGFFMERSPGSIHGLEVGPSSPTGCVLLCWRDKPGNWISEPEFAQETVDVPYESR